MPSYLVHFNRLHDKRGRFTYGDGDGDGRRDDRKIGEGDRSYDTPNSGRRNYEGGGGGRIGGGRTKNSATSKPEQTKDNNKPWTKREYRKNEIDYAPKNGNKILGDPRAGETSQARSLANQHSRSFTNQHTGTIKSVPGDVSSKISSRSFTNQHTGTLKSVSGDVSSKISSFGSTPPKKTPESKPGVGNGRAIGRDYGGTSRGAAAMTPINDTNAVAEELTEDMLEKRKKDEVKDYWQKKYQNAAAKGRSYVDRLFGKETTTNAKNSDKYRKTDNAGKHK